MLVNALVNKKCLTYLTVCVLFVSFFATPLFVFMAKAQPMDVLDLKWTSPRLSSGVESPLIVDIDGDGDEEVIWCNTAHVTCLDPHTGQIIWDHYDPYIYFWCQAQIADLENDGDWEIIVPLSWYLEADMTGIMVLDALTGNTVWRIPSAPGATGGLGGTSHSSPVVADVDGDGYKEIFTVTTDIYTDPTGYDGTGKVVKLSYDGQILATQWSWRSCSGGLSIADADNDGELELYMGDRNTGLGVGVISYSANDLTPRWNDFDMMVSSNIPVLADVNNDGQLDAISSHHSGGIAVYNMDGTEIQKDLTFRFGDVLAGHYQHSVYDIDYDGNLEILVADGEHGNTCNDLVILDLVDWTIDGRLLGEDGLGNETAHRFMFMGPLIADVTGDGRMDIVTTSWDEVNQGGVHVFSYDESEGGFYLVDEYLFLAYNFPTRPTAQDIDNDGLMEICVGYHGDGSQGGRVWAFDTPAPAPSVRPRSEVQFYSERRIGAAEYVAPPIGEGASPSYTLTVNVDGNGDVSLNPNQATYAPGTNVVATASAVADWDFDHWVLDGSNVGASNPYTVTMNTNHVLTAVFVPESTPSEIIIDDVDAVFAGTWPTSTYIPGFYGTGYRYHFTGTGSSTATWNFIIPQEGSWEVFAMWSSYPNRATDAPFIINHADGQTTVRVNQENQGSQWVSLGTYNFNTGSASVVLSDDANQFVIADAIRLIPSVTPTEIIVDDSSADFTGTWPTSTYIPGYYGAGYRYHFTGTGSSTATWNFNIPQAGTWEVFATWSSYPNRATDAPFTINHADGQDTVTVNQEIQGSQWVSLGSYNFNAGPASVVLSDDANQFVIADAIRLTPD